jgi:hypothetical protein
MVIKHIPDRVFHHLSFLLDHEMSINLIGFSADFRAADHQDCTAIDLCECVTISAVVSEFLDLAGFEA